MRQRRRILVVDDEPGMLRAVRRILGKGYDVSCANSPREALAQLEDFRPDLAILDIRMPDVDGFELMAKIKRESDGNEAGGGADVILMTGSVTEFDQKLIRAIRERAFYFIQKPFDRGVLLALVERCLELRRLSQENRRHARRLEAELDQARRFQQSLLPEPLATFGSVAIEARYEPCDELSGDLYSYARAPDGSVAFLVADVSGHGASAAMLTGFAKSAFHSSWAEAFDPGVVASSLAAGIRGLQSSRFITLFCGRLDTAAGRLDYVNAGHPAALLRTADDGVRRLESTSMILSPALPAQQHQTSNVPFGEGDLLLVYSDGVIEASNDEGELGIDRLEQVVRTAPARGCLDAVVELVRAHTRGRRLDDDVTLLGVEHRAPARSTERG